MALVPGTPIGDVEVLDAYERGRSSRLRVGPRGRLVKRKATMRALDVGYAIDVMHPRVLAQT